MQIDPTNLNHVKPLRPAAATHGEQVARAEEVRDAYRQFVGKTFFGQMLKSMRTSVGNPAYFHGGRAEEVFRSQLDQTLADHMTEASADKLADPMFANQFPQEAKLLEAESLADLTNLRRW